MKALDFSYIFDDFLREATPKSFLTEWDLEETDKIFKITMDLPGIKKEDLSIDVENNNLVISGERKRGLKKEKQLKKRFKLGEQVDVEAIKASYVDGVLEVVLPKAEKALPRKITITEDRV